MIYFTLCGRTVGKRCGGRGGGGGWAGYDHLFSRDSPKAKRAREGEGETSGTADGGGGGGDGDGDPRKMDRPNVGQITFFSGGTKTPEIGREKGERMGVREQK